jgi:hypothetical protein
VDDRPRVAALSWTVGDEQTFFGGQLLKRADAHEGQKTRTTRAEAELARQVELDDEHEDYGRADDRGAGGLGDGDEYAPHHPGEVWPKELQTERGRMPSLAPRNAAGQERLSKMPLQAEATVDVSVLREALQGGSDAQLWRWPTAAAALRYHNDPIVRVLQLAKGMLSGWHPAANGRAALFAGCRSNSSSWR